MLSPKIKRNAFRIIPFGITWLIFGIIYVLLEKGLLHDLDYYPATHNPYNFGWSTLVFLIFIFITGFIVGAIEILYLSTLFNKKSFGKKLMYKSLIYIVVIVTFNIIAAVISNATILQKSIFHPEVWDNVLTFLLSFPFLSSVVFITVIIVISLFFSEVSDYLGLSVLYNFFVGKYHNPIEEERIFMFLDMKSSTTIAENLGHVKYFEMLKEYYSDFTTSIIQYEGDIYQYVGDEIIVSWKLKSGLENNNCFKCFFALKQSLLNQTEKYTSKYGTVPTFKAGFHIGKVTTGEIGYIKKDIIFTGDVLNTTARIEGLCNTYKVDVLVSGQLISMMNPEPDIEIQSIGKNELRGRKEIIELFTILSN